MDYYVVDRDPPEDAPRELEMSPRPKFKHFSGEKVTIPLSGIVITMSKLKGVLDFWWFGSNLLMSRNALDVVKIIGETNFEAFPVTLVAKSGKRDAESTQIVNLLNNVSCMNKETSKFDVDEDDENNVHWIQKLVLDKTKIPSNRHLFRLEESPDVVIVSDALAEKWKAANLRGVDFIKPEKYKT